MCILSYELYIVHCNILKCFRFFYWPSFQLSISLHIYILSQIHLPIINLYTTHSSIFNSIIWFLWFFLWCFKPSVVVCIFYLRYVVYMHVCKCIYNMFSYSSAAATQRQFNNQSLVFTFSFSIEVTAARTGRPIWFVVIVKVK